MKIAIVKPGVPMEVALNKESRRKTPVVVYMKNERLIGDPALSQAIRYPKQAYSHFLDLLGKKVDNPQVEAYKKRFPYHDIVADSETGMVRFQHDEETSYSVEELTGMVLEKAKETAEDFAEHPISDAVITVPAYFNQAERRAVLRAAKLAGIKVLQLINDNSAVALNYGIFRRKAFNSTPIHYMFFDMGSASTTATIVTYQEVKQKNAVTGIVDKFPQLTIRGIGFDRTLGGMEMQMRLRDHLAHKFNSQKKTDTDVFSSHRAMSKLLKEAGRVKEVLSANSAHYAQVEGLLDDQDFKVQVLREELEEMCGDMFDRIAKVVDDAIKSSEMTLEELDEVILFGANTRMPKVQEKLMLAVGKQELGKSVNTDEASALGGVYQAAHLSKGFRVKKFAIKDATVFPIQVEFERQRTEDDGAVTTKTIKRTLFGRMNPYPQKKVMTFNKNVKDFDFAVNYGDLNFLSDIDKLVFGSTNLQNISLTGVEDAFIKHSEQAESKGVKAHFKMDDSGILVLDHVESVFEAPEAIAEEEQSTLSKLGSTISNLFGSSVPEEKDNPVETENVPPPETGDEQRKEGMQEGESSEGKKSEDKDMGAEESTANDNTEKNSETKGDAKETKQESEGNADEGEKTIDGDSKEGESQEGTEQKKEEHPTEEKSEQNAEKNETKEEIPKETKPVTVKEDIKSEVVIVDIQEPSEASLKASLDKMAKLKHKDDEKNRLEKAQNDLETFVILWQDHLYQPDYESCSTEEQREEMRLKLSAASDWLYEQEPDTKRKAYEDKLSDLQKITKDLQLRVYELQERPKALEALNSIMNYSTHFLIGMQNYTGEDQPFTEVEYNTLKKLVQDTLEWNTTIMEEQEQTPLTEKPKVLVEDFARKMADLDREVKYLINKAKVFRPKFKTPPANETKTETKNKNTTEEGSANEDSTGDQDGSEEDGNERTEDKPLPGEEQQQQAEEVPPGEDVDSQQPDEPLELEGAGTTSGKKCVECQQANSILLE